MDIKNLLVSVRDSSVKRRRGYVLQSCFIYTFGKDSY